MQATTILLLLTFTLCFAAASGQSKAKLLGAIRKEFKDINSDTTLKKVVLTDEEFLDQIPDGGGELTGFYKTGELKKIKSWIGLSSGNAVFEFYFKDGKLIFVYEQFYSFVYDKKQEELRLDTTERTFEGRYYFADGKLIAQTTTGHNRFEDDHINPQKRLLTEAAEHKKLLTRRIKSHQ